MLDWEVILHLNFTIKSSFFNEIDYWTEATFENNSDMEVKVTVAYS